jgi:hypothetical protein
MANWGQAGTGAMSGAATGAMVGSAVPVIGTGIGAAVGAVAGALPGLFSGDPAQMQANYNYNSDGTLHGYNFNAGNFQSPNMTNPGNINPFSANPYAGAAISSLQGLQGYQSSLMNEAFDPNYYNGLKANAITGQTNSIDNQYAKMGLAGSSANLGADQSAVNQTNMQFYNRQMQDQRNAINGMMGLDQNMYGDILGIQNQYGAFQNGMLANMMGASNSQNQLNMANNQMMAQMMGGAMQAGSSFAGMNMMANAMKPQSDYEPYVDMGGDGFAINGVPVKS